LPLPSLKGAFQKQNAAAVLMVLELLSSELKVTRKAIFKGLLQVKLKAMGLRWVNDVDDTDRTNFRHFGRYELNKNLDFMYGYKSDSFKDSFFGAEKVMIQFQYNFEKMEMK